MPEIKIDFNIFFPCESTCYTYYEILKEHKFIAPSVAQDKEHIKAKIKSEQFMLY